MQPERSLVGGIAQADVLAIAEHPGLHKRQTRAKQLWRELLALAGGRTGKLPINEAQMSALIGGGSLWRSNGSEGPLEALLRVRAVEKAEPGYWRVFRPSDAAKPRAAIVEGDEPRLPGFPPEEPEPYATPPVVRFPAPDSGRTPAGVPRESRKFDGGTGGRCAPDQSILKEQEQENSSCSYSAARDSRGSPATWPAVKVRLIKAGVYVGLVGKLLSQAQANGVEPADVAALCDYFDANPDRLALDAGALKNAVEGCTPELDYNARGLWPQVPLPSVDDGHRSPRQLADDREHARNGLYRKLLRLGCDREQINRVFVADGFEPIAISASNRSGDAGLSVVLSDVCKDELC